ncbi:MAG: uridylate kinase [Candidatus Nealsonbacteria bacterium CG_4_9_14_0_8_um_filter_35_12]|uniref:Isopentenyl phosphate kinase n=1 Tax=Candidatus Nealsonbacteria bacterium CG_4_9_14_0_8_um_filter_35_12 TaxID=1974692 RepID=A0A2M8DMD4_9BACT|nr:MAG: uridylate kinase [Candidatus Nealsonbacteria bacterium CG_4_9_14_0_8_um_filter_35_12]
MKNLILVKLGGSLITDKTKPFTLRLDIIKRLAREIREAGKKKNIKLIIGHGGGSFPHKPAKDYKVNEGIINKESFKGICLVQEAAARLNRIVVKSLIEAGLNAISVQPSAGLIAKKGRIKKWYLEPLKEMLRHNLLPVPYGDVALDTKKGCCIISTEEILNYLARKLGSKKIILAGITDGVFDKDPNKYSDAKLIPEINSKNYKIVKKYLTESAGIDITGGMFHKVERMLELIKIGVKTEIINGRKEGYLRKALLGQKVRGTIIK